MNTTNNSFLQNQSSKSDHKNLFMVGVSFLIIGTFLGYAITSFFSLPKRQTQKNSGFPRLPTSTPLPTWTPTPPPADTASFTLYPGQALLVLQKDLAMELPDGVSVKGNKVSIDGNEYRLDIDGPNMQGPCNWFDDSTGCGYDNDITDLPYVHNFRIWRDKTGVITLNPSAINFEETWLNHVLIYKDKPTQNFTQEEIDMWIQMFNHLTLID